MSSMCGNYANCLHSLDDHGNHNGLCLECHLACGKFIAEIEHLLAGHKLSTEDGIYLFLHRHGTLDDLARHLNAIRITDYLPSVGTLTKIRLQLQPVQAALICLRHRGTITAKELLELTTEIEETKPEEEEEVIQTTQSVLEEEEIIQTVPSITEEEEVFISDQPVVEKEEIVLSTSLSIIEVSEVAEVIEEEIVQQADPPQEPIVQEKPSNPLLDLNTRRRTSRLIANVIDGRKLPSQCTTFISVHMNSCKAAELDTLLGMTTCRHLALNGVIKNCYMAPPERTGRGNHREVWMIPVESIILVCDKHFNWVTILQAVIQLKKMYPGIVIDRNTLRKYVLKEGLCEHSTNLFGELAIPVSVLPEVPNRYLEIRAKLVKNKGIPKKALKPNELTPKQIFLLLDKKIPYKTVLDYLVNGVILGEKRPNRWVSTTEQYRKFLQDATNGVRGIKPEHIPICRVCLSKPYSIVTAEQ